MSTALVTGATAGIGAAFARALAARGHDLILVARDRARLESCAAELQAAHGVRVDVLPADLAVPDDVDRVAARLASTAEPVEILVNNAGFGPRASLLEPTDPEHDRAFHVMCRAVFFLAGTAAAGMRTRGSGRIINVGSLAGWISQGNYSAIKAWVLAYSEGLSDQLHGTGVTVTCVTPGWVRTEFHERAGIRASAIPDPVWVDADRVVAEVLSDSDKGTVISVPTKRWKLAKLAIRHLPRGAVRAVSRALSGRRG